MTTDLLLQVVTSLPNDLDMELQQTTCIPCSDTSISLGVGVSFFRSMGLAKEKTHMALRQFLPKKARYDTFLIVSPRFHKSDFSIIHDELLRFVLRYTSHSLNITGQFFTAEDKSVTFYEEALGSLTKDGLTRSVAEAIVKNVRRFVTGRSEAYSLQFRIGMDSPDLPLMQIHFLSPFIGQKSSDAPFSVPEWLPIFCDYSHTTGLSEHNTVVLQYSEFEERNSKLENYFRRKSSSPEKDKLQLHLSSLLNMQELGAKTLTIFSVINPELYIKADLQTILWSICKNTIFSESIKLSASTLQSVLEGIHSSNEQIGQDRSIHICDSSINSYCLSQNSLKQLDANKEIIINQLQEKVTSMAQNHLALSQALLDEKSSRVCLEKRIKELTVELSQTKRELDHEKRKVAYLGKRLQDRLLAEGDLSIKELPEELSPITEVVTAFPTVIQDQDDITLDEFVSSLPVGANILNANVSWDNIIGELDSFRCSSSLQDTRGELVKEKHNEYIQSPNLHVLSYENKILELQQTILEKELEAAKVREQIQDEYEEKMRNEISKIKTEMEQSFNERLRNLNPKAWYDYIASNNHEAIKAE